MEESCKSCKLRFPLTKFDYSKGGCKHTKLKGFVCMAFASEREAIWMVGLKDGMCECYTPRR